MRTSRYYRYLLVLSIAWLATFAFACANQNPTAPEVTDEEQGENTHFPRLEVDSSRWLTFTKGVRAILEDSKGNIWFGSHQEGLARYDGEQMTYYSVNDGLSSNQIRSIYEDQQGVIWFEGGTGVSSYDGERIITHTLKNYTSKTFWQSGEHDLWFKGDEAIGYNAKEDGAGVYRYDGGMLTYHLFPVQQTDPRETLYSVSTPFVKGRNGQYWFGTYGAVIGFDGKDFTIIDDAYLGRTEASGYLHVRSIFEDSQGRLWIGNNGIGVLLYDGDSTIHISARHGLQTEDGPRNGGFQSAPGTLEHVFSIGEDKLGHMWFGDRDTGAWRYDGDSFQNFTTEDGLPTTQIWQIYRSKSDELWFAMGDGSVCRFTGEGFERLF